VGKYIYIIFFYYYIFFYGTWINLYYHSLFVHMVSTWGAVFGIEKAYPGGRFKYLPCILLITYQTKRPTINN
jgi:hypothetical protein